jgi:hypothetical protein
VHEETGDQTHWGFTRRGANDDREIDDAEHSGIGDADGLREQIGYGIDRFEWHATCLPRKPAPLRQSLWLIAHVKLLRWRRALLTKAAGALMRAPARKTEAARRRIDLALKIAPWLAQK